MVYKAVALTRLVRPEANIPSTTALATINKRNGRELGLKRGANVFMPNLTPVKYRSLYQIYPAKACIEETGDACNSCLRLRIGTIGRHVGEGPGSRGGGYRPKPRSAAVPAAAGPELSGGHVDAKAFRIFGAAAAEDSRAPKQPGVNERSPSQAGVFHL
jgi:hypothetical protein